MSNKFNRISTCEIVKEIWDKLDVTHEGTKQAKQSKIYIIVHDYEMFKSYLENQFLKCLHDSLYQINSIDLFDFGT